MGTGSIRGQVPVSNQRSVVVLNEMNMTCEACNINFTLFKRRKICKDCGRTFCSACVLKEIQNLRIRRQCKKCHILASGNFTHDDLMQWKMKDLRLFLDQRNISTSRCTEKNDVVDILLHHFGSIVHRSNQNMSSSRIGRLTERMRQENAEAASTVTMTPVSPAATTQSSHQPVPESDVDAMARLRQRQMREMREAEIRLQSEFKDDENDVDPRPPKKRASLEIIKQPEDIENLSVKELKEILVTNFVDYKGCCEKVELLERVKLLWLDTQNNKKSSSDNDDELCKICMDNKIDCVLLECGHMLTCTKCGKRLSECPVCRQYVVRVIHTFRT